MASELPRGLVMKSSNRLDRTTKVHARRTSPRRAHVLLPAGAGLTIAVYNGVFLSGCGGNSGCAPGNDRCYDEPLGVRATAGQPIAARQQWTIAALQEHQSAAAQSAVLLALVRARVPLDFSATAASFPADELAHAEICARVANTLGGGAPVSFAPAQVFATPAPNRDRPLLHATILVARIFGVGEG